MFKKTFNFFWQQKIISGSFVMVAGSFLGSLTNYLFHLVTARGLGPNGYGVLDSLISIMYQISIPLATISLVIVKYVSSFKGQNRQEEIASLFWKINRKLFSFVPLMVIFFLILTPLVTNFLHLSSPFLFIIIAFSFILGIFITIGRSFLQGLVLFEKLTFVGIFEGLIKVGLTILFLSLGWKLFGVALAFLLPGIFSFSLILYFLRSLWLRKKDIAIPEKKEMYAFLLPVFLTNLGLTSFITTDIILARHFLAPGQAGLYAALSTMGKIIYFAASPITGVLFPMISQAHSARESVRKIVFWGLLMTGVIIAGSFLIFAFFPKMMILVLFGEKYLELAPFLLYFAIGISFYTVNAVFLNIYLARKNILPSFLVCFSAIAQAVLIIAFHNNLAEIVNIFIFVSALLFLMLLLYFFRNEKKQF